MLRNVIIGDCILLTISCSSQPIVDNCFFLQFFLFENTLQMFSDILLRGLEELCHHLLRHPDGFLFHADFHLYLTIFRGIEKKLACCDVGSWGFLSHAIIACIVQVKENEHKQKAPALLASELFSSREVI